MGDYVMIDPRCPICGFPGVVFRHVYQPAGTRIFLPRWRISCEHCREGTRWTDSREEAEKAWTAYCRLTQED